MANPCTVPGCPAPSRSGGLCEAHYSRNRRYGTPTGGGGSRDRGVGAKKAAFFEEALLLETDDCILWPFRLNAAGYGYLGSPAVLASRAACERAHGPAPSPIHQAAHGTCHNRACINPRHLSWKTPSENQLDRRRDGTSMQGEAHPHARLTEQEVREIRSLASEGVAAAELGRRYGVCAEHARDIIARKSWKHLNPVSPTAPVR